MVLIYGAVMFFDELVPIILKACPLYWVHGVVMLLMMFFSDKIPHAAVKWTLMAVLMGIITSSAIIYFGSVIASISHILLIIECFLTSFLILLTPSPRRKKAEAIFLK